MKHASVCRMLLTNALSIRDVLHIPHFDQLLQLLHQIHLQPMPRPLTQCFLLQAPSMEILDYLLKRLQVIQRLSEAISLTPTPFKAGWRGDSPLCSVGL